LTAKGVGGSGGFISILTIIAQIAELKVRPVLLATFGGVFGVANVVGPLLGGSVGPISFVFSFGDRFFVGVFTDRLTWRWCFYVSFQHHSVCHNVDNGA